MIAGVAWHGGIGFETEQSIKPDRGSYAGQAVQQPPDRPRRRPNGFDCWRSPALLLRPKEPHIEPPAHALR
jgi:hypothetical protein